MKEFFDRNKPVFLIGLITAVVFLVIIVLAQINTTAEPTLKKIENVVFIEPYTGKRGPQNAKVIFIEFSDFECPACKAFHPIINSLYEKYNSSVEFAYRHFPLAQHPNAKKAAIAAQAAGEQGKFWEYINMLFENQTALTKADFIKYAEQSGLNVEKFKKDLVDPKYAKQVENDINTGNKIGLTATPSFVINGMLVDFTEPNDVIKALEDEMKKQEIGVSDAISNTADNQPNQTTQSYGLQETEEKKEPTANGEVVTIKYTDEGFRPNNIKLTLGTSVKFENAVDRDIVIRQLISKYSSFGDVRIIYKGESYQLVLTEKDLWNFKEDSVRHYGSIFVTE